MKNVELIDIDSKNDHSLFLHFVNAVYYSGLICICHFVVIFGVRYNDPLCRIKEWFMWHGIVEDVNTLVSVLEHT